MKKILYFIATFVVSALFCGNTLFAQDIIVTKKSEKIEAKITDVEQDCIKYKKYNYQDGPTYTILKADIASIIYQNGDVETFFGNNATMNATEALSGEYVDGYCTYISIQSSEKLEENTSKIVGYVIGERIDGLSDKEIERKIKSGELAFFKKDNFRDYLEKYDTETFRKLKQGYTRQGAGIAFLTLGIIGAGCTVGGALIGLSNNNIHGVGLIALYCGIPTLVFFACGFPLYSSGINIEKRIPEMYNNRYEQRRNTSSMSVNVGVIGNGIGLQIRF